MKSPHLCFLLTTLLQVKDGACRPLLLTLDVPSPRRSAGSKPCRSTSCILTQHFTMSTRFFMMREFLPLLSKSEWKNMVNVSISLIQGGGPSPPTSPTASVATTCCSASSRFVSIKGNQMDVFSSMTANWFITVILQTEDFSSSYIKEVIGTAPTFAFCNELQSLGRVLISFIFCSFSSVNIPHPCFLLSTLFQVKDGACRPLLLSLDVPTRWNSTIRSAGCKPCRSTTYPSSPCSYSTFHHVHQVCHDEGVPTPAVQV